MTLRKIAASPWTTHAIWACLVVNAYFTLHAVVFGAIAFTWGYLLGSGRG